MVRMAPDTSYSEFLEGNLSILAEAKEIRRSSISVEIQSLQVDHLYLMQYDFESATVKIGRSRDVERRRRTLEASQNFKVLVRHIFHGAGYLERQIHKKFRSLRCTSGTGNEWFRINYQEVVATVIRVLLKRRIWKGSKVHSVRR